MPKINPDILFWSRETAGLNLESAAHKLSMRDGVSMSAPEKLKSYETGAREPSRSLLLKMSKAYRRPLLVFYLNRPPAVGDRGEDYRTLPDTIESQDNAQVDALIRDIKARQSIVRETLLEDEDTPHLPFIGSINTDLSVADAANRIRQLLVLDIEEFRFKRRHEEAFKFLREKVEALGIYVILKGNLGSHHSNIDVRVFRGFALADDIAPFVVINNRDAKSAWSFTLLHEIVHVLLGQTGVSGSFAELKIEKYCNDIASEILLPANEFDRFHIYDVAPEEQARLISDYAFSKKVSSSHIAYRLFLRGDIDDTQWQEFSEYFKQQWLEQKQREHAKNKKKDGGPNPYVLKKFNLGALVPLAQRLNYSGALSTTKTGMLLETKPLKVHRLFDSAQLA